MNYRTDPSTLDASHTEAITGLMIGAVDLHLLQLKSYQPVLHEPMVKYTIHQPIADENRILKSGCKVGESQLKKLERLEPELAFYMVSTWWVQYLTMLGRECPEAPCYVVVGEEEWRAVYIYAHRNPPPAKSPSLDQTVRLVASFGGFLNRKGDGFPGPPTVWIGLQRGRDLLLAVDATHATHESSYG